MIVADILGKQAGSFSASFDYLLFDCLNAKFVSFGLISAGNY